VTDGREKSSAERFETNRNHLRGVAYRMSGRSTRPTTPSRRPGCGSADPTPAKSATLVLADHGRGAGLSGYAAIAKIAARGTDGPSRARAGRRSDATEQEAQLADSIGLALLVVLQTLAPAERIAFVLHDMFDVPFDEVAPIVGRSPAAGAAAR